MTSTNENSFRLFCYVWKVYLLSNFRTKHVPIFFSFCILNSFLTNDNKVMSPKFVHFLMISLFVLVSFLLFFIAFNEDCNLLQSINANVKRQTNSYVRGCYFATWAQHRPDRAKFLPENYISGLCTHIYYAFVLMNDDFTLKLKKFIETFLWIINETYFRPSDTSADTPGGIYERVLALKKQQKDLKIILSFAGASFSRDKKEYTFWMHGLSK